MEKDIGTINKGEYQGNITDIKIGVREYNGRVGIDIREFATGEKYTGPTKKGLRIPAEKFEEFKTMINSIKPEDIAAPATPEGQAAPTEGQAPTEAPAEDNTI